MRNSPIQPEELFGVYPAIITPMKPGNGLSNPIDYQKLFYLIDDLVKAGVKGLVVAGTTGQSATLSPAEQADFVKNVFLHVREAYGSGLQFIVGAGSNSTNEAKDLSQHIENLIGPSTFLHVTGYYNNPPQEGLIAHFSTLAYYLSKSNIIMYNVPSRTGSEIMPETTIQLSRVNGIIGIKDASGKIDAVTKITAETDSSKFVVLSGEDDIVSDVIERGGKGVISASANIAPAYFVRIVREALDGNYQESRRLQDKINPLVKGGVFYKKNPIPLAHMFNTELRLPLVRLPYIEDHLNEVLARYTPESLGVDIRRYR